MRSLGFAILSSLVFILGASAETTPPEPGLTNPQAIMTFGRALMSCLQSRMSNLTISEIEAEAATGLRPAPAGDRWLAGRDTPDTTSVWITGRLGGLLAISEPSPERCEVNAVQLPVDRTFRAVVYAMQQARPDFLQVRVEPGFNPIVYRLESVVDGTRYIIHMEGAEPGEPGHALRFSLLHAYVERQPEPPQSH